MQTMRQIEAGDLVALFGGASLSGGGLGATDRMEPEDVGAEL
jgi:hypothetical protein